MKIRRAWAIARKEFLHIRRDPRSLGLAVAIPMLLLILFGYALTLDVDNVPLVVWDRSQSVASRDFISRFTGSRYFSLRGQVHGYTEIEQEIDTGSALVALAIPEDFARRLGAGRPVEVQAILDGSDANTATIARGYLEATTEGFSREITLKMLRRAGFRPPANPVDLRPRVMFNADMESKNYIVPGLIAVIMMVLAALLTSLTVAREWETGTMEQLISTPVKGSELVLGKLAPYFVIGLFDVLMAVLAGQFIFVVPQRGSWFLLFGMAAIFLVGALSIGLLISVVTRSQLLSSQLAMMVTYMPSIILSGLIYAIRNMPLPIQVLSYLFPARYFISLLKSLYLKGLGWEALAVEIGLMAAFSLVVLSLAIVRFEKKLR